MVLFWILAAMPVLGLLYTACVILRDGDSIPPVWMYELQPSRSSAAFVSGLPCRRPIKRISTNEIAYVVQDGHDVILIDLRPQVERLPVPFAQSQILHATPTQLESLLRWLPAASSVAVYGCARESDRIIRIAHSISGSAPLYVLSENR
jgi:hypothetical protein